jgi:hypothetical protein
VNWYYYVDIKLKRKKDDSVVATSLSWSKSICNPERGITRIRGPEDKFLLSKVNGQAGLAYLP